MILIVTGSAAKAAVLKGLLPRRFEVLPLGASMIRDPSGMGIDTKSFNVKMKTRNIDYIIKKAGNADRIFLDVEGWKAQFLRDLVTQRHGAKLINHTSFPILTKNGVIASLRASSPVQDGHLEIYAGNRMVASKLGKAVITRLGGKPINLGLFHIELLQYITARYSSYQAVRHTASLSVVDRKPALDFGQETTETVIIKSPSPPTATEVTQYTGCRFDDLVALYQQGYITDPESAGRSVCPDFAKETHDYLASQRPSLIGDTPKGYGSECLRPTSLAKAPPNRLLSAYRGVAALYLAAFSKQATVDVTPSGRVSKTIDRGFLELAPLYAITTNQPTTKGEAHRKFWHWRSSLFRSILDDLVTRAFVAVRENKLIPLLKGRLTCKILSDYDLFNDPWVYMRDNNYGLQELYDAMRKIEKEVKTYDLTLGDCHICESERHLIGERISCGECETKYAFVTAKGDIETYKSITVDKCACGGDIVTRYGYYGEYLSCMTCPEIYGNLY